MIERGLLDNLPPALGITGQEIEEKLFNALLDSLLTVTTPRHYHVLKYLRQYENSNHIYEANFYLAACLNDAGDAPGALLAYRF